MLVIKGTTKKGKAMIEKAKNNEGYYLSHVYSHSSYDKQKAWNWCIEQCKKEDGYNFHIISHNTFQFSVAWYVKNGVRIETSSNSYLVTYI